MTGYMTHDSNVARLQDMHSRAAQRRSARRPKSAREETPMHATDSIAIRRATEADRVAVARLAALDSADTPSGEILIAEVGDEPQAAIQISTGATIADPFRRTADVVELLRLRARLAYRAA